MDRVRLAIVGCGNICQLNAPGYLEHPRSREPGDPWRRNRCDEVA
jgi:hypothetical protein